MIDNERKAVFLNGVRWAKNILVELASNTPLEAEQRRTLAAAMVELEHLAASVRAQPEGKREVPIAMSHIDGLPHPLIPGHILQIAQDNADLEAKALLAAREAIAKLSPGRMPVEKCIAAQKAWREVTGCSLREARAATKEHFPELF